MILTQEQERMAAGENGKALGLALQTLIIYGNAFNAKRMVPIKSAHIAVTFGIVRFKAFYIILERLVAEGVSVKVPTTVNPRPGREVSLRNRFSFLRQKHLENMLDSLRVIPNYSCVCYEKDNIPSLGDNIAWAESSAVQFANSVLGARTNRNSLLIDVCSAVTGFTPEFGYLLDENRRGKIKVNLKIKNMDAGALGFLLGKLVVDKVPVLEHYDFNRVELKNMGGAMAASGGVALYHVEGLTPEAPDLSTVFDGKPEKEITVTQDDLNEMRYRGPVDMVVLGCPQMSFDEIMGIAPYFENKKVSKPTWFCIVPAAFERFKSTDLFHKVKEAGVVFHTCCPVSALTSSQGMRPRKILTASGKCYYYLEGSHYGNHEDCLRACGVIS